MGVRQEIECTASDTQKDDPDISMSYEAMYAFLIQSMQPGEEIIPDYFRFNPQVVIIANGFFQPHHLELREKDTLPIGSVSSPGKSAWFDFLGLTETRQVTPSVKLFLTRHLDNPGDRRYHVYSAPVDAINKRGFHVFWTPVAVNALHVRLVHASHLSGKLETSEQVNTLARERLTKIFQKIK